MELSEELIQQAKSLIDSSTKTVSLVDLQKQFNLTFYESLDLRKELIRRGLAVLPKKVGQK